ncbi:MAG: 50S ribosomal protein L10 [Parcubacteria group bacterium]|nr:50S ribosomal protein L10 [Parcubacteria group bacterium]
MLTKDQKKKIIAELEDILKNNENIIFTDFTGLTMAELMEFKRDLKKDKVAYKVFKKSLLEHALARSDKRPDLSAHKGSIALAYSSTSLTTSGSDVASLLAKKIYGFAVKSKKLSILAGYLINEMRTTSDVVRIAKLPSREVLLAQVLQLMMSPVTGLARVLDGIGKKEKVV